LEYIGGEYFNNRTDKDNFSSEEKVVHPFGFMLDDGIEEFEEIKLERPYSYVGSEQSRFIANRKESQGDENATITNQSI